jgi:hypothetical protein
LRPLTPTLLLLLTLCAGCREPLTQPTHTQEAPATTLQAYHGALPLRLSHEADLHAEEPSVSDGHLLVLRDYSHADNFRSFSIQLRLWPASPGLTEQDIAARAIDGLGGGVVEDLQILDRDPRSLHARYRYIGGREHYTDPNGHERSSDDTPLDMRWRAQVRRVGAFFVLASIDATPAHLARRQAGFDALLQSLAPHQETP